MNNEWIYTKDRLPERSMTVLVTLAFDNGIRTLELVNYSERHKKFNAADIRETCEFAFPSNEVIAWIPAPDMAEVRS